MSFPLPRAAARQDGAATAAFALTAVPLLFCALFAIEAARWHITRQILNLALLEAARAGATAHGRPAVMEAAFETALLPLFQPAGPHDGPRDRMRASFLAVTQQTGAPPWRIDVLSPTASAYADFADAALRVAHAPGRRAISNDYQAEQHLRRRRMGWPGGRGPRSGQTIFEANTLRLRLTYAHPPLVPGLRALLRQLAAMRGGQDPAARAGMLVIAMEIALPMQSHPVQWQAVGEAPLPDGSRRATAPRIVEGGTRKASETDTDAPVFPIRNSGRRAPIEDPWARPAGQAGDAPDDRADVPAGDAACGVILCCLAVSPS